MEDQVAKRGVTVKKVVVEKEEITKLPSNARMSARSKRSMISDKLSDPQSPSPSSAYNNTANVPPSFAAPNLQISSASTSTFTRGENAFPKDSMPRPTSTSREDDTSPEDGIKESANNADIVNSRSEDEEHSTGSEPPHKPKPGMSCQSSNENLLKYANATASQEEKTAKAA